MKRVSFTTIVVVFAAAMALTSLFGCTKDMPTPEKKSSPGLDTIPFYKQGQLSFSTTVALREAEEQERAEARMEEAKEERKVAAVEEMEKRFGDIDIPDPWISPAKRELRDLPPALRGFPKDNFGYPDWTSAVEAGMLKPKSSILGTDEPEEVVFEEDIVFKINDKLMANVRFSHKVHTFWLSCKNCHPGIFIDRRGANQFSMYDVWNGKFCGRCHGKVSYQPKGFENCQRCHSETRKGHEFGMPK